MIEPPSGNDAAPVGAHQPVKFRPFACASSVTSRLRCKASPQYKSSSLSIQQRNGRNQLSSYLHVSKFIICRHRSSSATRETIVIASRLRQERSPHLGGAHFIRLSIGCVKTRFSSTCAALYRRCSWNLWYAQPNPSQPW